MYSEFPPSESLERLVSVYMYLDIDDVPGNFFAPDITHTCVMVTVQSNVKIHADNKIIIPPVVSIKGAFDAPFYFSYIDANITSLIADFQPIGMYEFTGVPGKKFANQFVDATTIWEKKEVQDLMRSLAQPVAIEEKIECFNSFLDAKAPEVLSEKSLLVEKADELAKKHHYQWSIKKIAYEVGVSETSLKRAFNEVLGISPKQYFARSLFEEVLKRYIVDKQNTNDILLDSPFYDFSHINKWFKKFAHTSPSEFVNYDIHFIEEVLARK